MIRRLIAGLVVALACFCLLAGTLVHAVAAVVLAVLLALLGWGLRHDRTCGVAGRRSDLHSQVLHLAWEWRLELALVLSALTTLRLADEIADRLST